MADSLRRQTWQRLALIGIVLGGAAFALAAGMLFMAGTLFPFARVREMLVAASNLDGAGFFTESYYAGTLLRAKWAGVFCLASALALVGLWIGLRRRAGAAAAGNGESAAGSAPASGDGMRLRIDRTAWLVLALATVLRLPFLFQPGSSDEVRGYYAWTARPFALAISDYRAPQHLLYTLLDYPVVRLFGNAEWAIRLPAFLAGICLPALLWAIGRKWFGRPAGLLAAILLATSPVFVHFSVNGRAYTLHACMVLLLWLAATRLAERPSRGGHAALVLAGVVGLVALPTMAYPLAGTYGWLALVAWTRRREPGAAWGTDVGRLVLCGATTIWLAALAYLPAYVASDRWYSVDGDDASALVPWRFLPMRLGWFLVGAFRLWNEDVPGPIVGLLLAFSVLGAIASWRQRPLHLLAFNLAAILGVSVALRMVPYVRVALYFGMAYFLVAGVGLARTCGLLWKRAGGGAFGQERAAAVLAGLTALLLAANVFHQNRHGFTEVGFPAPGVRALMAELTSRVAPGDHFVCAKPTSGPLYYYHLRNGLDCRLWFIPEEYPPEDLLASPQAVYFVVNAYGGQTLESVLRGTGWPESVWRQHRFVPVGSNRFAGAYLRERR
ncbi:MAG: hypothetical protein EOL90_07960 [Spartobacteria bacterium]|nr:hypothetical protein [Spartobacteria bacterium]